MNIFIRFICNYSGGHLLYKIAVLQQMYHAHHVCIMFRNWSYSTSVALLRGIFIKPLLIRTSECVMNTCLTVRTEYSRYRSAVEYLRDHNIL